MLVIANLLLSDILPCCFCKLTQVHYLGEKGGATVYQTVGSVLRELITNRLGLKFNMKGAARHQKIGLLRTKLFTVIYREY